jgi:hypothetical protein
MHYVLDDLEGFLLLSGMGMMMLTMKVVGAGAPAKATIVLVGYSS